MGIKFSNLASTTLASGVSSSTTSISVTSATSFPTLGSGDYFYASIGIGSASEVVKVTSISGTTFTAVRGQDSTTAISHSSGAEIALRVVAATLEDLRDATDNYTTYSVQDGELSENNFTNADHSKLDGIATNANNYSHPSAHAISFITGLQTALDGKVDDSQVLTNVPSGAVFTDTVYTLPFTDNSTNWNTAYGWGNHASAGYLTSFDITTQTDSKYLRSDTDDTMNGNLTIDSTTGWSTGNGMLNVGGTGDGRIQVRHIWGKSSTSAGTDHLWLNYANSNKHVQIGTTGGGNNLYVADEIYAGGYFSGNLVWNAGNDGSGSGLDADLLDGQHGSYYLPTTGKAADSEKLDGLDSTDFKQDKWYTFTVGGDLDKFYPALFTVTSTGYYSAEELEISQSNVHRNGSGHGAFWAKFGINITGWGHIPQVLTLREYSKSGNTYISRMASTDHATSRVGIWLRGSTTYAYRSNNGAILSGVFCTDHQPYKSYNNSNDAYDVTITHDTSVQDSIFNDSMHSGKFINTQNIGTYAWTASNDGAGSGLDADSVDGYNPEESAVNNSLAKRDGTGTLKANAYYDGNDTAYYTNPAATSIFSTVKTIALAPKVAQIDYTGVNNGTFSFTNPSGGSANYTNRGGRVLTSNASGWHQDGEDPTISIVDSHTGTDINSAGIGLYMHNEQSTNSAYSPAIMFGSKSASGSYNSMYGAIYGRKTTNNTGVDTNWNSGELHFFSVGSGYVTTTPDLRIANHGEVHVRSNIRAPIFYDSDNTAYYTDPASTSTSFKGQGLTDSKAGFKSTANPWNTSDSAFFPNGITTNNTTNWIYGTTFLGGAPSNGSGNEASAAGTIESTSWHKASLYYDRDNTAYYVDPASTGISANFNGRIQVGTFTNSQNNTGEAWIGRATDRSLGVLTVQLGGTAAAKMEIVDSGWTTVEHSFDEAGISISAGSKRAPIFYDSNNTGFYFDGSSSTTSVRINGDVLIDQQYGKGVVGVYASTVLQHVWAMGGAYRLAANGSTAGNMYGMAWSHPNAGTKGGANHLNDHGLLIINNGGFRAAISSRAVFSADVRGTQFYDYNDTAYYIDPSSTSNTGSRMRGGMLFGPNTTWNEYLYVGGNGRDGSYASVASTNGNLHLDGKSGSAVYLAWYTQTATYVGGDIRAQLYYDRDNTAYYADPSSTGTSLNVAGSIIAAGSINVGDAKTVGHGAISLKYDLVYMTAGVISPSNSDGTDNDNAVDLGKSAARFNDIYATNSSIQTSDRNEKQDIEELSDAEQRVAVACKGLLRKFRWKSAVEEKGEDARIHFGIIAQDLQDAFAAEGLDAGRYAMFISSTWTNEDGEEQTRMGVRYSELLAFIISAI